MASRVPFRQRKWKRCCARVFQPIVKLKMYDLVISPTTDRNVVFAEGMGDMEMPDGWTMSMVWMRMPGQTWLGAAASFLGMWVIMMAAMMLPALVPTLLRYRRAVVRAVIR